MQHTPIILISKHLAHAGVSLKRGLDGSMVARVELYGRAYVAPAKTQHCALHDLGLMVQIDLPDLIKAHPSDIEWLRGLSNELRLQSVRLQAEHVAEGLNRKNKVRLALGERMEIDAIATA